MLASGYQLAQKGSSTGSAIAVSQDGLVLTNHHVVDNCKTIEVTSEDGRSPASVKASDRATDLALLQSRLVFPSAASFRLTSAEQGEPIAVVGFPFFGLLTTEGSVSFGHVTALRGFKDDFQKLQISAPVPRQQRWPAARSEWPTSWRRSAEARCSPRRPGDGRHSAEHQFRDQS